MLHYLHPARDGGADAIKSQPGHRAENERKRGNHLWLHVEMSVKKPERHDHNERGDNGLRNTQHHGHSKKRPAPRVIAHCLRTRDECCDRIIETKHADLADDISSGPGNRKYAERCRPEQPRNEKREYAAEIRRQHRDRVEKSAALQLHSRGVHARRRIYDGRRNFERNFGRAYLLFAESVACWGNFKIRCHEKQRRNSFSAELLSLRGVD